MYDLQIKFAEATGERPRFSVPSDTFKLSDFIDDAAIGVAFVVVLIAVVPVLAVLSAVSDASANAALSAAPNVSCKHGTTTQGCSSSQRTI